nr:dioxygenase [Bailinhaonella thermotolerans]
MTTVGLGALATPVVLSGGAAAAEPALTPTPSCDDGDDPTPAQIEGPYFKPNSPRRTNLITAGVTGTRLTLTGVVYTMSCAPVANALLDFWQADAYGRYDNVGYRLRGHQFTTATGSFTLQTIVPGLYPGRTRHIHVKVQAPGRPILTTQLYFPGEPRNASDAYYNPALLMSVQSTPTGRTAQFDFVLRIP